MKIALAVLWFWSAAAVIFCLIGIQTSRVKRWNSRK
jgi:hypothetical protein